jgi:hypothetical protein
MTDLDAVEQRLSDLDARVQEIVTECRQIRETLASLLVRIEPMMQTTAWVDNVIKHKVTPEPTDDEPPPPRTPLLCRWLGHSPGPKMGLMVTCTRCGLIYRLGRGV